MSRNDLLILLNVEDLFRKSKRPKDIIKQDLASSLNESTREVDVKGWYRRDSLIGIVCTEVDKGKRDAVVAKVKSKLLLHFGPEEIKLIRFFHVEYPEYEALVNPKSSAHVIEELQAERKGMFYS